jgi:hypothetical protein
MMLREVLLGDGVGVEDGIISLEPNDDFAMGAPPGAPGAIDEGGPLMRDTIRKRTSPDATPRAGTMDLPMTTVPTPIGRPGRRGQDAAITPTAARGAHRNRIGDNIGTNALWDEPLVIVTVTSTLVLIETKTSYSAFNSLHISVNIHTFDKPSTNLGRHSTLLASTCPTLAMDSNPQDRVTPGLSAHQHHQRSLPASSGHSHQQRVAGRRKLRLYLL